MKSIISTTYDDKYLFFLPLVTFAWNKLGVDVICFVPRNVYSKDVGYNIITINKVSLINKVIDDNKLSCIFYTFETPEHKEATYAQCSRLYAACLDLPEDEILVTGDVDMAVFKVPEYEYGFEFTVTGDDLVPVGQYPMCYVSAKVKDWRNAFDLHSKTYQEKLDELLSSVECENMRGNYWSADQEQLYNKIIISDSMCTVARTNGQNQFATKRYDRDDAYLLDRLSLDTIDYHMPRPGYEENNFNQIMTVLNFHYPGEDFTWLKEYRDKYVSLL